MSKPGNEAIHDQIKFFKHTEFTLCGVAICWMNILQKNGGCLDFTSDHLSSSICVHIHTMYYIINLALETDLLISTKSSFFTGWSIPE